ncbi:MAG: zinc-binding dehydrogenase [Betaproteobacteria bacterium]|nr:zinc-binding dehydrogenase [Betaproteobacteria bacterium]
MKCFYIDSVNGKTVYEPREMPKPKPKAGEMLVRVRAASLNRGEIMASISLHKVHEAHPAGGDCAGEVEAVGEGVTAFKPGDAILGRARGSFAEYVVMGAVQAAPKPERLSWEQAAAVPIVSVTAYEAMCQYGKLKAGETMLVAGAASGVGMIAVQAGKYLGARVIGISRSKEKLEKLKAIGMDVGIQAGGAGFADKVRAATGGKGVDLSLNLIGGTVFPDLVRSAANQGRIAIIGYVDNTYKAEIDLETVHGKRLQIFGVSNALMTAPQRAEAMRGFARDLLPGFADGRITPVVDKVFAFDELPAAKTYVESNAQLGKVVVRIG